MYIDLCLIYKSQFVLEDGISGAVISMEASLIMRITYTNRELYQSWNTRGIVLNLERAS